MNDENNPLPLAGVKVIELHAIGPVPFAGMLLQNLGAQVTRIAPISDPGLGIAIKPEHDHLNLGKTSTALDLKSETGLAQLKQMLHSADVLLEGFRPGVLERLGLGPDTLSQVAPQLVIGRLNGWGTQGPLAPRAGHDINYLAMTGALLAIGTQDEPVPPLNLVADFGGGAMHLAVGVLAKLVQRGMSSERRGGIVATSILAGSHGLMPMFHGMVAAGLQGIKRQSHLLDGGMPFYRVYRCADNRFIAIGSLEPKFYAELIDVLGLKESVQLKDQYSPKTWAATTELIAQCVLQKPRDVWAALALNRDACLSPVLSFSEAAAAEHNQANGWFIQKDSSINGRSIIQFEDF
jgi:alpha-methylacyl-CoA racemase